MYIVFIVQLFRLCYHSRKIFNEGDELELDVHTAVVKNLTTGRSIQRKKLPPQLLEVQEGGGLMPLLLKKARRMK